MIRVFLVDDHTLMRDGLRAVLATQPDLAVVGEASNGQELLDQLPDTPADVVLLDMNMPVLDGLATTIRLRERFPNLRILMLSMLEYERSIGQVLDAGAHGYVLKNADKMEIVTGILTVAAGKQFLCSELGLAMLRKVLAMEESEPSPSVKKSSGLSFREREVLQLISNGLTNQAIADKLFTSKRTIETHRQNIIEKTGVKNTAALIKHAMDQGWINVSDVA
ncbi:response regulator [Hymenobacter volaticus]|uniref:Response regulator transcription factor n=1 Tax=Hymenobacter volaticus TaxID=2932254 RepID=A0ABY4GCQ7_9BACT|nr:response regulator transcription factor [Hymenobacter volaticus]UOQ68682.1 response regulator transcription factor [Hymenobacter volaticus]